MTVFVNGAGRDEELDAFGSCLIGDGADDLRPTFVGAVSFDPLSFDANVPAVEDACDVTTVVVGAFAIEFFSA